MDTVTKELSQFMQNVYILQQAALQMDFVLKSKSSPMQCMNELLQEQQRKVKQTTNTSCRPLFATATASTKIIIAAVNTSDTATISTVTSSLKTRSNSGSSNVGDEELQVSPVILSHSTIIQG